MKFGRVDQFPSILWRSNPASLYQLELCRWLTPLCAFIFFGFFGFADEARIHYRSTFNFITKTFGISSFTFTNSSRGEVHLSEDIFKTTVAGSSRPDVLVNNRGSKVSIDISFNDAGGLLVREEDGKSSTYAPTLSYAGGTLSNVGATLDDYSEYPIPSSGMASSLSLTRHNSTQNIEISPLQHDSTSPILPIVDPATEKALMSDDV